MDPKPRFPHNRTYPTAPAPNDDISSIKGNCTPEQKQCHANILAYYVGADDSKVFARNEVRDMKLVEINVNERKVGSEVDERDSKALEGQIVCEIVVKEGRGASVVLLPYSPYSFPGMLNRHGTLAGACLAHILDMYVIPSLRTGAAI